ncbi:MAG TPA: hypothetical protein VM487_17585 [Phycisphaerae bacterium]|nr:hypothetical protein [Phycisphaerae bacterium]
MPNGDFHVTFDLRGNPVETEQMRYLEGFGLPAQQTVGTSATQYLHGDLIRSTNLLTDGNGAAVATTAYTAFGELVTGYSELATRYQYAGGWGYETGGFGNDPGACWSSTAPPALPRSPCNTSAGAGTTPPARASPKSCPRTSRRS